MIGLFNNTEQTISSLDTLVKQNGQLILNQSEIISQNRDLQQQHTVKDNTISSQEELIKDQQKLLQDLNESFNNTETFMDYIQDYLIQELNSI